MSFLKQIINEQKEMDPSVVTAKDVSTYVRQVKIQLKGQKLTKSAVSSAVHEIIEDDPKFGANPKIASQLISQVFAKLNESVEQLDELSSAAVGAYKEKAKGDADGAAYDATHHHNKSQYHFKAAEEYNGVDRDMWQAHSTIATYHAHKAHDKDARLDKRLNGIERAEDRSTVGEGAKVLPLSPKEEKRLEALRNKDFDETITKAESRELAELEKRESKAASLQESWDDEDDEDPDVKIAAKEAKRSGTKLLSKKAEAAIGKKLSKADKSDEDKAAKKVDESATIDVDELPIADVRDQFLQAAKRAHPDVKDLVVKSDGKELRAEVPGKDRCYGTLCLTSGKVTMLGESWDNDDDEDPDVKIAAKEAKRSGTKLLSKKAEAALGKKLSKADTSDEDKSAKKVDEARQGLIDYLKLTMVAE